MNRFEEREQQVCEDQIGAALRTIDGLKLLAAHETQPWLLREIAELIKAQKRIIKREQERMPTRRNGDE